jgi:WD40 repeat protein
MNSGGVIKEGDFIQMAQKQDQPRDTVQVIRWLPGPKSPIFAAAGWDGKLHVYEVVKKSGGYGQSAQLERKCCVNLQVPVLSLEWVGERQLYVGTADSKIMEVDLSTGKLSEFARPTAPVIEIKVVDDRDHPACLFFQMDERMTVYLPRNTSNKVLEVKFNYRIVAADVAKDVVLVAFESGKFVVCRLKDLDKSGHTYHDSQLGKTSKISAVSLKHDASGFVLGSGDGRFNICDLYGGSYSTTLNFHSVIVFRGMKNSTSDSKPDVMDMVTAVQFSQTSANYNCFLGSSSGGELRFWDPNQKDSNSGFTTSGKRDISCCRANSDWTLVAVAIGYSWSQGITGLAKLNFAPEIMVLPIDDYIVLKKR